MTDNPNQIHYTKFIPV